MLFTLPHLSNEYLEVLDRIETLRKQLKYATSDSRRKWTGLLRRSTFARGIQGSNSIEGYNVTEGDALAAVDEEEPGEADPKAETWKAISGYRSAMSYILQLADDPFFSHNEGTLKSLHYMMVGFDIRTNPGRWRPGEIWVRNEASGDIVYRGPDVALVPGLIGELIGSLNDRTNNQSALVKGALAHLNLAMIHPFSDGNGRMARALQTMVLAREGILDPTFSSIEEYLGRYTPDYYAVLGEVGQGAWHPERGALPWLRFCLVAHHRQAETLLRRTKEIQQLWDILESEIRRAQLPDRCINALADAAVGYRVQNSGYRKLADVSQQVASNDLNQMVRAGLLKAEGEKRGRFYLGGEPLRVAWRKSREPKTLTDPFEELEKATAKRQHSLPGIAGQ